MFRRNRQPRSAISRSASQRHLLAFLPELYRSPRALDAQPSDAEDLVHDTCLKAFAAFGNARLESEAGGQAWLRRILINHFRVRYRRQRRSPVEVARGTYEPDDTAGDRAIMELAVGSEPPLEQSLAQDDCAVAVEVAFATLPSTVRTVAALHIVGGLAYMGIARLTDAPLGTGYVRGRVATPARICAQRVAPRRIALLTGRRRAAGVAAIGRRFCAQGAAVMTDILREHTHSQES
ncbi:MAG: RNA polymerase sigma-70 factor (ECF subfamily) [Gammaproteobacteria bacterium]|jgi:RNA polymerase sigma-70 factor (ECF subfamily)